MNGLDRWAQYNYFWDVISPTLSTPERQVWLAIFRHADTFGVASVTRSRIGDMIGVTPKAVSDGIKGLSKRKLIAKIPHGYGYKLCITCNENVTPTNEKVTDDSNENVTLHSRKRYTPCNEKVTTTVTKTLHNTELPYRTDIQNIFTEEEESAPQKNEILDAWNEMANAAGLSKAMMTKKRTEQMRVRMKESAFVDNWREALKKIPDSDFLTGKSKGGWRASIDWFLSPDAVVKTVEGKYDNAKPKYDTSEEDDIPF